MKVEQTKENRQNDIGTWTCICPIIDFQPDKSHNYFIDGMGS